MDGTGREATVVERCPRCEVCGRAVRVRGVGEVFFLSAVECFFIKWDWGIWGFRG